MALIKPGPWAASRAGVSAAFRTLWDGAEFIYPLWGSRDASAADSNSPGSYTTVGAFMPTDIGPNKVPLSYNFTSGNSPVYNNSIFPCTADLWGIAYRVGPHYLTNERVYMTDARLNAKMNGKPMSFTCVIRPTAVGAALPNVPTILDTGSDGNQGTTGGIGLGIDDNGHMVVYKVGSSSANCTGSTNIVADGNPHVVTFTWDGSSSLNLYIDGRLDAAASGITPTLMGVWQNHPAIIGSNYSQNGPVGMKHYLYVIWSRALTPSEAALFRIDAFGIIRPDNSVVPYLLGDLAGGSGSTAVAFTSTLLSITGFADTFAVTRAMADLSAAGSTSSLSTTYSIKRGASGTSSSVSGASSSWSISRAITSTLASVTGWSGSLITGALNALSATLSSVTALSTVFAVARKASGTSSSVSATSTTYSVQRAISGSSSSVSGTSASWSLSRLITSTLSSLSSLAGSLYLTVPGLLGFSGVLASVSNFISTWVRNRDLRNAGAVSQSSARGALTVTNNPQAPTYRNVRDMPFPPGHARS